MENTLQNIPPNQVLQLQQEDEKNLEFTCEICFEQMPNEGRKFINGNICCHPFCIDCMIKYIHVQVNDKNVAEIPCPALNCDETLDPVACGPVVGQSLFVRWCDVLCESAISGLEQWNCPDRNCNALIVNECAFLCESCPDCRKLFCLKCKGVWRGGHRCEAETGDQNEVLLRDLVARERLKRCPWCGYIIQLMGGCSIVRCRCGFRFCYNCENQAAMCRCNDPSNLCIIIFILSVILVIVIYFMLLIHFEL